MSKKQCTAPGCANPRKAMGFCTKHYRRWKAGSDKHLQPVPAHPPLEVRFWSKVNKGEGCWEWTAYKTPDGYGRFMLSTERRLILSHRFAWESSNGPIPEGLNVLHRCDNPACVNSDHLFLGTQADNVRDMMAKGRRRSRPLYGEDHPGSKLSSSDVQEIRTRYAMGDVLQRELADEFGVTAGHVSAIVAGAYWSEDTQPGPLMESDDV